ncbi:S8 family peptidase [Elizabethkingia sp. JS20170427COW]|uniref:S8 family peptidase n=1 Tax=Elizabethkingia sp. JS20170427COW TaxID=2583851 RepID=UPI001110C338|nr:S8 family peptidase [Elizabethkingia sp. JS20170427COW]QCX53825.1 T9SS type A sorting domain-containing protein [Elizabethkingia sp. JS20170427COW]
MNKNLLLIGSIGLTSLFHAQSSNEALMKRLEQQKQKDFQLLEGFLINQRYSPQVNSVDGDNNGELHPNSKTSRENFAGFALGKPLFYDSNDGNQITNSNADYLQNGQIQGLEGSFNGENLKFTVFDGGRVFEKHALFNNLPNRIVNKEASTHIYSSHATAVAGFIGNKPYSQTINDASYQFQGIAKNSFIDAYRFANTTLPNDTAEKNIFEKILVAQPKISNHSYGINGGWEETRSTTTTYTWWGYYNSSSKISYDLQGAYFTQDRNYDNIVYLNPSYIIVKSAGNYYQDGPTSLADGKSYYYNSNNQLKEFTQSDVLPTINCKNGYDCIGPGSLAKNIIVVAANDILTTSDKRYHQPSDVVHSSYSSAGPRDDGGIKPDITAVGTGVGSSSTNQDTTGSNGLLIGSGTSYSAPIVTGIIGLWMQINKQLFNGEELNASTAKTLMVHSAAEAGNIGPDPHFGWGFIDAKKGAELLVDKLNQKVTFEEKTLNNNGKYTQEVVASGTEPLKATISWIDPEFPITEDIFWKDIHNNRNSRLINDLDLRIIDTVDNTTYSPWKLDITNPMNPAIKGDNTVDNVEQVVIDTPTIGRKYRIEVSHKGNLVNNSNTIAPQKYSILVSGFLDSTAGTEEVSLEKSILLYPSVASEIVHLEIPISARNIQLFDISGKLLNQYKGKPKMEINIHHLQNGVYLFVIDTEKGKVTKKFIKN